jgi:hypothetical protein
MQTIQYVMVELVVLFLRSQPSVNIEGGTASEQDYIDLILLA